MGSQAWTAKEGGGETAREEPLQHCRRIHLQGAAWGRMVHLYQLNCQKLMGDIEDSKIFGENLTEDLRFFDSSHCLCSCLGIWQSSLTPFQKRRGRREKGEMERGWLSSDWVWDDVPDQQTCHLGQSNKNTVSSPLEKTPTDLMNNLWTESDSQLRNEESDTLRTVIRVKEDHNRHSVRGEQDLHRVSIISRQNEDLRTEGGFIEAANRLDLVLTKFELLRFLEGLHEIKKS